MSSPAPTGAGGPKPSLPSTPSDATTLADIASGDVFRRSFPPRPDLLRGMFKRQQSLELTLGSLLSVMRSIEIRPKTLMENLRANLFPDKIEAVVSTFKGKLLDITLDQVSDIEEQTRKRNKLLPNSEKSLVVSIEPVNPALSIIPWGIMHRGATLIGAERWTVARVHPSQSPITLATASTPTPRAELASASSAYPAPSPDAAAAAAASGALPSATPRSALPSVPVPAASQGRYRVNYYSSMGGDFFYSDVLPEPDASAATGSQWAALAVVRGKQWWAKNITGDDGSSGSGAAGAGDGAATLPQPSEMRKKE